MIPIYLTSCLAFALGLIGIRFPGAFSIPSAATSYGYQQLRDWGHQIRLIVTRIILLLVISYTSLTWGIYHKWVGGVIFGLVSIAVTFTLSLFVLDAFRAGTVAAFDRVKRTGTWISGVIKLQTVPFHALPPMLKIVGLIPITWFIYGLYLIPMLTINSMAQIMVIVGELGPTVDSWMKNALAIIAGIGGGNLVLAVLIIFQDKHKLDIVNLETLGYGILVIALLINSIYLLAESMISIRKFIAFCIIGAVSMVTWLALEKWFPAMFLPIDTLITTLYDNVITSMKSNQLIQFLVMLIAINVVTSIPWARARNMHRIAAGVALFLWVFSQANTHFWESVGFWIGVAGVGLTMLIPKKQPTTAPGTPAAATTGGGHGGHGNSFPWGWAFGFGVLALIGFMFWIGNRNPSHPPTASAAGSSAPPYVPVPQYVAPAAPSSAPAPAPAPAPVVTTVTKTVRFQLNAALLEQSIRDEFGQTVKVKGGDKLVWDADQMSQACQVGTDKQDCAGPEGQLNKPSDYVSYTPEQRAYYRLDEYPLQDAHLQELIGYVAGDSFPIGLHKVYLVPPGTGETEVLMGANIKTSLAAASTGGHTGKLTITTSK